MKKNRRDFLRLTGLAGLGTMGAGVISANTVESVSVRIPVIPEQQAPVSDSLNRFPRMMQEFLVNRVKRIEQASETKRNKLLTKTDAEAYVADVRSRIKGAFGPWPEKTPLNARVTGILKRGSYTVEKLIFESRPGFPVTANLYIPAGRKFPLPGVIGTVGHSKTSKAYTEEQSFAQGLVSKGYVVLTFDPPGQGERVQLLTADLKPRHGSGTSEHFYTGNPLFLTGDALCSWFAWDGIRALDYLLTRKEVDKKRVGVTGNSGGGMQATYLCALDDRFTMAAPCCWVTTWRHNLENEEVADTEQCPPGLLGTGIDQSDFIAAMAPRPVILLTQEKDFFDTRGTQEAFARLKHLYTLLGAPDNIQLFRGSGYHGYSQENREAMYRFFNTITSISANHSEPAILMETEEMLRCSVDGQVGGLKVNTIFSYMKTLSGSLKENRGNVQGEKLKQAVRAALRIPLVEKETEFRILRSGPPRGYPKKFAATYMAETEPGAFAFVYRLSDTDLFSRPPGGFKRALLYISHQSSDDELRTESWLQELISSEPDSAIFACDVRGTGESRPNTTANGSFSPYWNDYFYAVQSIMLGYPYVGQKTNDILNVIRFLKSCGHEEIHVVAKGWGSIPATFAALLSENISQVTLKNALTSYSDVAENEEYNWPLSSFLPGVLKTFDLPDCYHELAARKLRIIDPWGAMGGKNI